MPLREDQSHAPSIRWIPPPLSGLAGSAGALLWYWRLKPEERAIADRIAEGFALDLFDKARWQLSDAEAKHVTRLTRQHFTH